MAILVNVAASIISLTRTTTQIASRRKTTRPPHSAQRLDAHWRQAPPRLVLAYQGTSRWRHQQQSQQQSGQGNNWKTCSTQVTDDLNKRHMNRQTNKLNVACYGGQLNQKFGDIMYEWSAQESRLKVSHGCKGGCAGLTNFLEQCVTARGDNKKTADSIWEHIDLTTPHIPGRVD
jgi:hypothetical protein